MSKVIEEALTLIDAFEVRRVREIDKSILDAMTGPTVEGVEQRNIIAWFNSVEYVEDDLKGHLASFVVMSPTNIPLIFFSIRCGELFEMAQPERMRVGYNAREALRRLMNRDYSSDIEKDQLLRDVKAIKDYNMTPDDIFRYAGKKESWEKDEKIERTKEVTKVLASYPAVELKLFGINDAARAYWVSLGLPKHIRMGETRFWLKVVETLEAMHKYVGCQFVYLFAADKEAEGKLVQYYRVRLKFKSDANLSANKPQFDWQSQFLYQSIEELFEQKIRFRELLIKD